MDHPHITESNNMENYNGLKKVNPNKPRVLFVGHWQTMQTRIRRSAASDQGLHCLHTERYIQNGIKMKNTTQLPLKRKWTVPIDRNGNFHLALKG